MSSPSPGKKSMFGWSPSKKHNGFQHHFVEVEAVPEKLPVVERYEEEIEDVCSQDAVLVEPRYSVDHTVAHPQFRLTVDATGSSMQCVSSKYEIDELTRCLQSLGLDARGLMGVSGVDADVNDALVLITSTSLFL